MFRKIISKLRKNLIHLCFVIEIINFIFKLGYKINLQLI